jgi:hypothetical protein
MTTAEIQLNSKVASLTTRQLCEAFELTNENNDDVIPVVRGVIMNELESRNQSAFDAWMGTDVVSEMDKPSKFFF